MLEVQEQSALVVARRPGGAERQASAEERSQRDRSREKGVRGCVEAVEERLD